MKPTHRKSSNNSNGILTLCMPAHSDGVMCSVYSSDHDGIYDMNGFRNDSEMYRATLLSKKCT